MEAAADRLGMWITEAGLAAARPSDQRRLLGELLRRAASVDVNPGAATTIEAELEFLPTEALWALARDPAVYGEALQEWQRSLYPLYWFLGGPPALRRVS